MVTNTLCAFWSWTCFCCVIIDSSLACILGTVNIHLARMLPIINDWKSLQIRGWKAGDKYTVKIVDPHHCEDCWLSLVFYWALSPMVKPMMQCWRFFTGFLGHDQSWLSIALFKLPRAQTKWLQGFSQNSLFRVEGIISAFASKVTLKKGKKLHLFFKSYFLLIIWESHIMHCDHPHLPVFPCMTLPLWPITPPQIVHFVLSMSSPEHGQLSSDQPHKVGSVFLCLHLCQKSSAEESWEVAHWSLRQHLHHGAMGQWGAEPTPWFSWTHRH